MSVDATIPAGASALAGAARSGTAAPASTDSEAKQLGQLATEFESMLLLQMLREMRKAGSWQDEDEGKGLGAEALFDTLDVELSSHLAKAQGFGLEKTLVRQVLGGSLGSLSGAGSESGVSGAAAGLPVSLPFELTAPGLPGGSSRIETPEEPGPSPEGGRQTTSPFGWRRDPFTGEAKFHRGVDLSAAYGEPIGAAAGGRVVFAGEQGGYGQTVVVQHADGLRTRYAHLSAVLVEPGAEVAAGDALGRAGRSGRATGTHLHFEVTRDGRPVDPDTLEQGGLKPERVSADLGVGAELTNFVNRAPDKTWRQA